MVGAGFPVPGSHLFTEKKGRSVPDACKIHSFSFSRREASVGVNFEVGAGGVYASLRCV